MQQEAYRLKEGYRLKQFLADVKPSTSNICDGNQHPSYIRWIEQECGKAVVNVILYDITYMDNRISFTASLCEQCAIKAVENTMEKDAHKKNIERWARPPAVDPYNENEND